ncbi:DUF2066 domain-containing protein [Litorivicinus lipolyticus]|uniref:DUF2066 domain-containing protein n=1 Tax=Litorivicinus lipolyticus TaxID=418701 RepID=A0A5Q2QFT8_9GAMM|nr:DUF2066 domain-containing protein [Litorivicinus lipolyticus]QGG80700.1 DUF2066 domain-containing protein [Litorivicinus lipolyticus]
MRIFLFCLIVLSSSAGASLYQVTDLAYSGDERSAKGAAVMTVLARLTGRSTLDAELSALADEPDEWVQSWGLVDPVAGVAEFRIDPSIRQAVQRLGRPVWTTPRTTPWLWLMVDEGRGRQPLTAGADLDIQRALMIESERMALPISLPAWDADDRSLVSDAELWGLFFDGVEVANGRYGDDYVAGRLARIGERWQLNLRSADGRRLNQTFASPGEVALAIHGFWLPTLVADYAVVGSGDLSLSVAGLTANNFAPFMARLRGLDAVEQAFPVYSDAQYVRFRVITGARPEQLADWLGLPINTLDQTPVDLAVVARP